eukprot:30611-Eustigmatos_ZCMA.PRE.1
MKQSKPTFAMRYPPSASMDWARTDQRDHSQSPAGHPPPVSSHTRHPAAGAHAAAPSLPSVPRGWRAAPRAHSPRSAPTTTTAPVKHPSPLP